MKLNNIVSFFSIVFLVYITGCSTPGNTFFKKQTPHEAYAQKLKDAGLHETALGRSWAHMAAWSLKNPVTIDLPFREQGYLDGSQASVASFLFSGNQGEHIIVKLETTPPSGFNIFLDIFFIEDAQPANIKSFMNDKLTDSFEVEKTGTYILRLQPELLQSGNYKIDIMTGPSLAYPIKAPGNNHIKSFWGASRDGGRRSHEGVDMFANFQTPVVAAADGRVTRVAVNNLGGKVVFMRPEGKNYSLYYAHLDSQLVSGGEWVRVGDTLGLMGNTGNAKSTAPHLHFGIYTPQGAVNPLPFINPSRQLPEPVQADENLLGSFATISRKINIESGQQKISIPSNTVFYIAAANKNQYRIIFPDSSNVYVQGTLLKNLKAINKIELKSDRNIYEKPHTAAPVKAVLKPGAAVEVLGSFKNYFLVKSGNNQGWIVQ